MAFFSWQWLSRLGEAQILLPLVLLAAAWLWRGAGQGRLALRWLLSLAFVAALTTLSKLAFMGWAWGVADWDFTGLSGHAMFAAACLPMLAWVALARCRRPLVRRAGVALAFALAAAIAYSRLPLRAHSPSELLLGFALGAAASLVSLAGLPRQLPRLPHRLPAALAAALLILPVSAPRSRTHDWVMALSLQLSGREQPYTRESLLREPAAMPSSMQPLPALLDQ
ncbi:phosphatase PAP2 family protein [Roseateles violae]|uniref:Phosphatase PAP2 family protein n=1 Tax=Roseateles violae TaxID=3058042 RepID=A0ABT8DLF3_9BURK|nr:phosphatase PAP2 family protein [Pelomonas sp. PFR6]MDN3919250.1 phosphatase PAP2 family protein [Pelomonas sp. PFR6]